MWWLDLDSSFENLQQLNTLPLRSVGFSLWIEVGLLFLGVAVNILAAVQHRQFLRSLERSEPYRPPRFSLGIAVAIALAAMGLGTVAYLLNTVN